MATIPKFSGPEPAGVQARAWRDGLETVVSELSDSKGSVSLEALDKFDESAPADQKIFVDNIRNYLEAKGQKSAKAELITDSGWRYVRKEMYKVSGGAKKPLTLLDVRKLAADLVEDGYALRGKKVPASVRNKLDGDAPQTQAEPTQSAPTSAAPVKAEVLATQAPKAPIETKPKAAVETKPKIDPKKIGEAQKAKDPKVTEVFVEPASRTSTTVRFEFSGSGKEIRPGERWLFQIPEDLRGGTIRTAILAHRKDSKYTSTVVNGHDNQGAYNEITARKTGTDHWVCWSDQYGSRKFAEPRDQYDPENENLHDWVAAVGEQSVDLLAITNVGHGDKAIANVHLMEIEFYPAGKTEGYKEEIFTPGTHFADFEKGFKKPTFGGGMGSALSPSVIQDKGLYPDAYEIESYGWSSSHNASNPKNGKAYVDSNGNLRIPLPAGKKLGAIEIACGDTNYDRHSSRESQRNKDGHYGELGWAKLYAKIDNRETGQSSGDFMVNVNVPPAGVLSGGPKEQDYITKKGDEIVVRSEDHMSWVMGYRVQFLEK